MDDSLGLIRIELENYIGGLEISKYALPDCWDDHEEEKLTLMKNIAGVLRRIKQTNDAVEVVRCKDCVRWNTIFDRTKAEYGLCQIRSQLEATKNDDFCSRGERRTDGQT